MANANGYPHMCADCPLPHKLINGKAFCCAKFIELFTAENDYTREECSLTLRSSNDTISLCPCMCTDCFVIDNLY